MSDEALSRPLSTPLPCLSERHNAMLAEMGVNVWWSLTENLVSEPVKPVSEAVVATVRPAATAPRAAMPPAPPEATSPVVAKARVLEQPVAFAALDRQALEATIGSCQLCDLGLRRHKAVPGMGDPEPEWLVVGEAPGEEEDRQGLPFVGRAGALLDRMLAAMGLSRTEKVYIANVIKCRPPQNRNPDPVEIDSCTPYLIRQVELLRPRIVLAMGRFAAQTVLSQGGAFDIDTLRQMPLGKLRGRVHEVTLGGQRLPVVVTYHPAYLLRSPAEKAKAWADLCLAMDARDRLGA